MEDPLVEYFVQLANSILPMQRVSFQGVGMASKKAQAVANKAPSSSTILQYADTQVSIGSLLNAKEGGRYQKNKTNEKKHDGVFTSPCERSRSNAGSAGASPYYGSSDDGFQSSQQTLSPPSSSPGMLMPCHQKMPSAPELANFYSGAGDFDPKRPFHKTSASISETSHSSGYPTSSNFHGRSISQDGTVLKLALLCVRMAKFSHSRHHTTAFSPYNLAGLPPAQRSTSLDPMVMKPEKAFAGTAVPSQDHHQPAAQSQMHYRDCELRDPQDGRGPLPPGWDFNYHHGQIFFINNYTEQTTYNDPRRDMPPYGYPYDYRAQPIPQPDQTKHYLQQLSDERAQMQARQRELQRTNLSMQQQNVLYPQYNMHPPFYPDQFHDRGESADSAVDGSMDIDLPNINIADLNINPGEMDQYL